MVGSFICLSWPYCAGQAFSHLFTHGLRVLGPLRYDGSCECSQHFAGCQCFPPHPGGEIDYNPLRWCILTGTDCLAYAERCRMNSSDAEVAILTRRPYRRPLCRKSAMHRSTVRSNASSKIPTELRRRTRTSTTHTKHERSA